MRIKKEEIERANRAHVAPSCPACGHFNAMLFHHCFSDSNEVVLKCRDCGRLSEPIARSDMPNFC